MFRKLEVKMILENINRVELAKALNIEYNSLTRKMRGVTEFKWKEINIILRLLKATYEEIFLLDEVDNVDKGA